MQNHTAEPYEFEVDLAAKRLVKVRRASELACEASYRIVGSNQRTKLEL